MARRKQNPIKDIGNQVGSWLGGAARVYADITDRSRDDQPGRLPQVQAALNATRAIGRVVDTATGGFGSAVVSDAQRMAKTGSSTPSALYKTAAVNLAAGAVGAGAAQVAAKTAGKVVAKRVAKAEQAITPTNTDRVIYHSGSDPSTKGPFSRDYKPVDKRPGLPNVHMGTETAAVSRQETRVGWDSEADIPLWQRSAIDRYEIVNPKVVSKRKFSDHADFMGPHRAVQAFDDVATPKNKILKYNNRVEDVGSTSYLVPKSRVESGDVVYRGSKEFRDQFKDVPYTSPELNRLRNVQTQIVANVSRARTAAAGVAALSPKKNRGSKNKR